MNHPAVPFIVLIGLGRILKLGQKPENYRVE